VVNNLFNSTKSLNTTWFGGTALAIAYTSDITKVKPSDMTVISVNTVSPWYRNTDYKIPAGLPACPSGGCLCTWNWIHQANHGEGYPYEIVSRDHSFAFAGLMRSTTTCTVVKSRTRVPAKSSGNLSLPSSALEARAHA
jgi:hypothetical protein